MAHKTKKYSFQRNKKKTLAWVIGIVAVIAAIVIGVLVYNSTLSGDIEVPAPDAAKMNNIADNWQTLATHTDKVTNEYAMYYAEGVDENGATVLTYTTDLVDVAQSQVGYQQVLHLTVHPGEHHRAAGFFPGHVFRLQRCLIFQDGAL